MIFHGLRRLPRSGEELRTPGFTRTHGGGALITAVATARSGVRVAVASALGDDAADRLRREGVTIQNLRRPGEPHAVSVALSTGRERTFVTFDGVNRQLEDRLLAAFDGGRRAARHVHLALRPHDLGAWAQRLDRWRTKGVTTSWDFGWHEDLPGRRGFRRLLRALDWVLVNEREALHYADAPTLPAARTRWAGLSRGVVIKLGARGATASSGGRWVRAAAPRIRVVDTTGAGDAFNGGFLAALLAGGSLDVALRAGVHLGSLSTRAPGGLDGLPTRRELRGSRERRAS